MKATLKFLALASFIFSALIYFSSCDKTDDDEILNPDKPGIGDDPNNGIINDSLFFFNAISNALLFNQAQAKSGVIPVSSKIADLKIDKKVINIWPGIKARIRILKEQNVSVGSISIQITGADKYYDVAIEQEESSDTLIVFYLDIDPEELELPLSGKIKIAPMDENGDVIDDFECELFIDTPFDDDNYNPGTNNKSPNEPALNVHLYWIYTSREGELVSAPGHPWISSYETMGCCNNGFTEPCGFQAPNATILVDQQYSLTNVEVIVFRDDNIWQYQLERRFNDYDPKSSDFCTLTAGYKSRSGAIVDAGTYAMEPANGFDTFNKITIQTSSVTLDDVLNTGFGPITKVNDGNINYEYFLGSSYYVERVSVEGSVMLRVFEATDNTFE